MPSCLAITKEILRSPLFYAYWALNCAVKGAILYFGVGLPGTAISAIELVVGVSSAVLFYQLLKQVRRRQVAQDEVTALRLFGAVWYFRLCLALLSVPFLAALVISGYDKKIFTAYQAFLIAAPDQGWPALWLLLKTAGLWAALFFAFCLVDTSGAAIATVQGKADRAFRNAFRLFPLGALPITLFFSGELVVSLVGYAVTIYLRPLLGIVLSPYLLSLFTTPAILLLQVGSFVYVGARYRAKAPQKLR